MSPEKFILKVIAVFCPHCMHAPKWDDVSGVEKWHSQSIAFIIRKVHLNHTPSTFKLKMFEVSYLVWGLCDGPAPKPGEGLPLHGQLVQNPSEMPVFETSIVLPKCMNIYR